MNKEFVKQLIVETSTNPQTLGLDSLDRLEYWAHKLFNTPCFIFDMDSSSDWAVKSGVFPYAHEEDYDGRETFINLIEEYKEDSYLHEWTLFTDEFIATAHSVMFKSTEMSERFKKCLVIYNEDKRTFNYVSEAGGRFSVRALPVNNFNVNDDWKDNYNDDIPIDSIREFVNSDKSGLGIFYGTPGCGKSSIIRHLISTEKNVKFYWLDQSMLGAINNSEFLTFLIDNSKGVFIIEDCETLLTSRNNGSNSLLSSLLNISDGLLGDSLKIKFICTFNTDLRNIDKAVLRKGRLRIKYEFKALTKDKVQNLFNKLNITEEAKEMPLCDIYNIAVNTGHEENQPKKIGF